MSDFYADLADVSHEVIVEFGTAVVLNRKSAGGYDPITGTTTANTSTPYPGFGVKLDYEQKDIDGTLIRIGDQRVLLSVVGVAMPQSGDTLTFTDPITLAVTEFDVVRAKQIKPANTAVLYDVQVRGLS